MALSMAMDLFDLGDTLQELTATLGRSRCRWLIVSFSSDWLFPPDQSRDMVNALVACNDYMALGAMGALEERGLQVPSDVAVIGFDESSKMWQLVHWNVLTISS